MKNFTQKVGTLALALTLGSSVAPVAANAAAPTVMAVGNDVTAMQKNEEAYQTLKARLDQAKQNYQNAVDLAAVLNQTANYESQLNEIKASLDGMEAWLEEQYAAVNLNETSELPNIGTVEGQLSQILQPLTGTFNYMVSACFQRSFPVLYNQINPAVSQLASYLQQNNLSEQFATELAAVQAKATTAATTLTEYQTNVGTTTDYKDKLALAQEAETYINNMWTEIQNDIATIRTAAEGIIAERQAAVQAEYERLSADFAAFQELYQTVSSEFYAIAAYYQAVGNSWPQAQTYGGQLGGMQSGMQGITAALQQAYAAGTLTSETTLASLYPQYADMQGSLNSMKSQFEQTIAGMVQRSIMPDLSAKIQTSIPSAIGDVENQLAVVGMTEQYADRMTALNTKKTEASNKFNNEYLPAISAAFSSGNYAEAMTQATAAMTYVNRVLSEVTAECEAIKAEIQEAYNAKVSANEAAYASLMAQIAELETYYNEVYTAFMAAAATQPQGWATTYGNQLGGIQGAINGMKSAVGGAYGRVELTAESNINDFGNYDSLKTQLDEIMSAINVATGISTVKAERLDGQQVYDLGGRRVSTVGKGLYIVNGKKVVMK